MHGLVSELEPHARYWFRHEVVVVRQNGVFVLLATNTGNGFVHSTAHKMRIVDL